MKRDAKFLPKWTVYDDEPYPGPIQDDEIVGVAQGSALEGDLVDIKDDLTNPLKNLAAGLRYAANAYESAWKAWVSKFAPEPEHAIQKPDLEKIRARMNNGPKRDPFKRLGR